VDRVAERIRVLLADDHPVYRAGLAGLIEVSDGLEVVGQAADGLEAVDLAIRLQPDVAVLDLNMPGLHGLQATRQIVTSCPATAVLVLTMYDDDTTIFRAMQAGARGYAVKTESPSALLGAIRSVGHGEVIFSGALAARLGSWFDGLEIARTPLPQLTPREREVLTLMTRGRDNSGIAVALGVSVKTVRNIVSNVLAKLQCATRAEAVAKAREAGIV
jgi:DNA-binding NarL/FixJ family response regulator